MSSDADSVAIIGIGCRFPGGVTDPGSFWQLLSKGVDAISEIPASRIDLGHYFDPRPATPGRMMTRWGGFLDALDEFDPEFFGMSPREAEYLDPQQRLLLETAWEALEDAGQDVHRLEGSTTAVFVGQWLSDFEARLFADPEAAAFYMTTGSGRYAASGRLSYLLGLRGPSLTLDSACSSSLAAVHLAVRSIRSGESELAIAGGANVILQPHISIAYSQSRMMAPDGHCKFGDAKGDGYVRSEGAGLVVMKPMARAQADGDRIYAVIRGSAVNNDGHSSGSMGTPSRLGQEELLRSAYRDAGVAPQQVGYIEAHGTGTRAGDPVEVSALGTVLAPGRDAGARCLVGSVKTNIGHTEGAAGIAGVIKAALAIHHGAIPASLHFQEPNPVIAWSELPFTIPTANTPWPANGQARTAGVNSFGIAGTNAHVVLQEAPAAAEVSATSGTLALLSLSAKNPQALRTLAERHALLLESANAPSLRDLCWTAATRRAPLDHRAAFVAADRAAMAAALRRYAAGEAAPAEGIVASAARPRLVFVFPGQGAQWVGMARELMACEPVFQAALARCDAAALPWLDASIVEQLALEPGDAAYQLDRIDVIQPVLVALAIAYAALWRSWGVEPDAVVGHSMGEVGAAHVAGVLDLDQAMRIICRRSALMRRTSGQGAMALVELSMADAQARIAGRDAQVSVAVSNSPRSSVISGDPAVVKLLMTELEKENVFCRLVKVDVASHSPQMEPLATELAAELADMSPHPATTALYSTVLARRAQGEELGAAYWASNLRQPVRFGATVQGLLADGLTVFVELGPHPVLLPSIQQTAQAAKLESTTIACARREEPERSTMLAAIGGLHCAGIAIDWRRVMPEGGRHVTLPCYPWQRERHWADAANMTPASGPGHGHAVKSLHPVLGSGVELAGTPAGAVWGVSLEPRRLPAWFEHGLHGSTVLPASAYLEMALAASRCLSGSASFGIRDLQFARAMHLLSDEASSLQVKATASAHGHTRLEFQSHTEGGWTLHANAQVTIESATSPTVVDDAAVQRLRELPALGAADVYARLDGIGAKFGPSLRSIAQAWFAPGEALARIEVAAVPASGERYCVAPVVLDACFQLMVLLAPKNELWLPVQLGHAHSLRPAAGEAWIHAKGTTSGDGVSVSVDAVLFDAQGPVLVLEGLMLKRLAATAGVSASDALYAIQWTPAVSAPAVPAVRQWVLIPDCGGVGESLASLLRQRGAVVHLAGDPAKNAALIEGALRDAATLRTEIVDLRMLDVAALPDPVESQLHALVQTAQTLGGLRQASNARLWLVTRGATSVTAQQMNAMQAPAWGLGAVLAAEHGDRWGGNIDLDPSFSIVDAASALLDAVTADAGSLAWRAGELLQPRLQRIQTSQAPAAAWRKDASYLLTGGLGGVGLHIATWLAGAGVRHLVVMARTPLPARTQWQATDAASPQGRSIAAIRQLEALGLSVHHAAVDVADESALRAWLERFNAEGRPPVRGVFHAAGITDDKLVHDLDPASLQAVLAPKLRGGWNLHRLFPELDHFVLFSSMAAFMPQAGQASYAAANAFLDALAAQRSALGQPALSIGWGAWAQTGVMHGDVGQRQSDELARQGIASFTPEQAVALLGEALTQPHAHVAVMPIDWSALRQSLGTRAGPLLQALLAQTVVAPVAASDASAAESSDPAERRRALERAVRDVVGRVLKLVPAKIDARKPLGSMGLTSLMALELRNRLEPLHGKPLSATLAWNYPTVDALVTFLVGDEEPAKATVAPAPAVQAEVAAVLSGVNELSDEDAARLLRKRR